jgi:hypothetical protein
MGHPSDGRQRQSSGAAASLGIRTRTGPGFGGARGSDLVAGIQTSAKFAAAQKARDTNSRKVWLMILAYFLA